MKKIILIIIFILLLMPCAQARMFFTGLTGGTTTDLDGIDPDIFGIAAGYMAYTTDDATGRTYVHYWVASGSCTTEASPTIIVPDSCSGDTSKGYWALSEPTGDGYHSAAVSDPKISFPDSDAAGASEADEEAGSIQANMTTTTEDAEVTDWGTFWVDAGTHRPFILWDGSDKLLYIGILPNLTNNLLSNWAAADVAGGEQLEFDFDVTRDGLIEVQSDSGSTIVWDGIPMMVEDDGYLGINMQDDNLADGQFAAVETWMLQDCGENISKYDIVYFDNDVDPYKQADANLSAEYPAVGIATAACTDGNPLVVMRKGVMRNSSWSYTRGNVFYVSGTPGAFTTTEPTAAGDCGQQIGFATGVDEIYFDFRNRCDTIH